MLFKNYNVYENKLSEQLENDNPYKKKLIQMETPTDKHPIYSGLVFGLLTYSWIFFIVLLYNQIKYESKKKILLSINILSFKFSNVSKNLDVNS